MWVKLDDNFPDHPKIQRVGPDAAWLYVAGLCYCGRHLTDGKIPVEAVSRLTSLRGSCKLAARLLHEGLWEEDGNNYVVHDWSRYNPSKAKVEKDREAGRLRVEKSREKRECNGVTSPLVTPLVTATRPDPTRETKEEASSSPAAPVLSLTPAPKKRAKGDAPPSEFALRALARLNELAGTRWSNGRHIDARIAAGASEADVMAVIEFRGHDPWWVTVNRCKPASLFGPLVFVDHLDASKAGPAPQQAAAQTGAAYQKWKDS